MTFASAVNCSAEPEAKRSGSMTFTARRRGSCCS
jgi:hypothetical protein